MICRPKSPALIYIAASYLVSSRSYRRTVTLTIRQHEVTFDPNTSTGHRIFCVLHILPWETNAPQPFLLLRVVRGYSPKPRQGVVACAA
jgi:hypothetical protein